MKRCILILLALMLTVQCLPGSAMNEPVRVDVKAQLLQAEGLSESGLAAANKLLSRLQLRMTGWPDGEKVSLFIDGQDMWQAETVETDEETRVIFSGDTCYVTEKSRMDALEVLSGGEETVLYQMTDVSWQMLAEKIFGVLQQEACTFKTDATEITNARAAASYDLYTLSAEKMNGYWPQMLDAVWESLFPEGGPENVRAAADISFTGDVRIKRLYDAGKQDMGLQLTGNGQVLGTERKISVLYGYTPGRGGSMTLSLRPVQGKDTAKVTAALRETVREDKTTCTFSFDYSNTLAGVKETLSVNGKCTVEGEKVTGEVKYTAPDGREWILKPDVTLNEKKQQGTVEISAKEKKKKLFSLMLEVSCAPAGERETPVYEETVSLKGKTDEEAKAALFNEEMVLLRAVKYLMDGLQDRERWLLTHELRTDDWHTAPRVPVMKETDDTLLVEEDAE